MEFRILGALEVVDGDRRQLGRGRQSALLALLILHANEVVLRDRIVEELWPADPPSTASKIVQGYVVQLRKIVGDSLLTRAGGYVLQLERDQLDATRAEDLLEQGRSALSAGRAAEASETLRRALGLWQGPSLADFTYESFAQGHVARLEELRLEILEERIEADLALGRHAAVVGELESLVANNPLRERLRAQLMTALYRSGRQAEALDVYRDGRRRLDAELGLEPGPELRELERAILAHDPSLAPPARTKAMLAVHGRRALLVASALAVVLAATAVGVVFAFTRGGEKTSPPTTNYVDAIDARTNRLVGRIAVGHRPTQIAASPKGVWLLNADAGTISAIDPASHVLVKTAAVGIGPTDLAFDGQSLWVSDSRLRRVFQLDPKTLVVLRGLRFPPPVLRHGARGSDPVEIGGLALGANTLWVGGGAGNLFRLNATTGRVEARITDVAGLSGPEKGMVLDGTRIWVRGCCMAVTGVDAVTNSVTEMIRLPEGHALPGLTSGAGAIWVTDETSRVIWVIDPHRGAVVRTVPTGPSPAGVAVGFGSVWLANSGDGTVWRINPSTGRPEAKIDVGGAPAGVAVGADRVWVTVG